MADSNVLDVPDGVYSDSPSWSGMIRHPQVTALVAGAYPVKPPSTWFEKPKLAGLTPLTIDDDGRVYGHIAAWHTSHVGMAGGVKPPRSKSDYAYYKTGVVKCDDGKMVNVGQITLTGGHAPLNAGVQKAVAHYDDTASAIMDVNAGEDKHGIWVAGALRPEVTDAQLRSIRASSVSGDWRPINGKLELVAVCAVNSPGFPIPRARVASGAPIALVAAGTEPLVDLALQDRIDATVEQGIAAGLELFRERVLRLENVVLADSSPEADQQVDAEQLRRRVRGGSAVAASLRERVRGPQTVKPEVADDVESLAASLRERVKGRDASPKAIAPEWALTAARKRKFNPLLHPRGADGKFIEKDSWVRWLREGFGSAKRGKVISFVTDPKAIEELGVEDGVPVAIVEFPDGQGGKERFPVPFSELERVAPPKGQIDLEDGDDAEEAEEAIAESVTEKIVDQLEEEADGDAMDDALSTTERNRVEETVKDAVKETIEEKLEENSEDRLDPSDEQLVVEELSDTTKSDLDERLLEIPQATQSDEWTQTTEWFEDLQSKGGDAASRLQDELDPNSFSDIAEWAEALRAARERYEEWRTEQIEFDNEVSLTLDSYLNWLEEKGMRSSLVAAMRTVQRVKGGESLLARATEYWTEEKRKEAAASGVAMPNGQYPIEDKEDLRKSIKAFGRARNPVATKRHIMRRASILGHLGMLPDGWVGKSGFDPAKHLRGPDGRFVSQGRSASASPENDSVVKMEELRGRIHGSS